MTNPKHLLLDVTILRPLAILLLVIIHSFTIYNGGWAEPIGFEPITAYKWVARISLLLGPELFVFMAGYVFGYQHIVRGKKNSLGTVIKSKFKRLIIPSIIFSSIYFVCFGDKMLGAGQIAITILSGTGHMWFLPMIFWCFIGGYLISEIRINDWIKILFLAAIIVFSFLPLPFQINTACYYLIFFYTGYLVLKYKDCILNYCYDWRKLAAMFIIFLGLYSLQYTIFQPIDTGGGLPHYICLVSLKYIKMIYTMTIILVTLVVTNWCVRHKQTLPNWVIESSSVCYGVYIFHQFILEYLYYHTSLPILVGAYWLPIVGLTLAITLSFVATRITLKSRVGRYLIG